MFRFGFGFFFSEGLWRAAEDVGETRFDYLIGVLNMFMVLCYIEGLCLCNAYSGLVTLDFVLV